MNAETVFCSGCSATLAASLWERESAVCRSCGQAVWAKVFPALAGSRVAAAPEGLQDQAEASCFFHAQTRASVPCDDCGRFLCALCAIEIPGRTVCPTCLESGISGRRMVTLETTRLMHDSIALALATIPALLMWPAVVTAPLSIFWAIRHWNSPRSVIPRSRIRLYLAIVFGLIELGFVGVVIFGVVVALRNRQ